MGCGHAPSAAVGTPGPPTGPPAPPQHPLSPPHATPGPHAHIHAPISPLPAPRPREMCAGSPVPRPSCAPPLGNTRGPSRVGTPAPGVSPCSGQGADASLGPQPRGSTGLAQSRPAPVYCLLLLLLIWRAKSPSGAGVPGRGQGLRAWTPDPRGTVTVGCTQSPWRVPQCSWRRCHTPCPVPGRAASQRHRSCAEPSASHQLPAAAG